MSIWTTRLLQTATSIAAHDASAEMIALNRAKVASEPVSYVQSDLFTWQPRRTYDAVCFGFWLSNVPSERLDAFLRLVATALRPGGGILFVDDRREPSGTAVGHHSLIGPLMESPTLRSQSASQAS